ncbi:MAG: YHS domain-containing protein [Planctomycetes bacterium]|nr:YHS domain-containing protein [Planctomycetota bacterium]
MDEVLGIKREIASDDSAVSKCPVDRKEVNNKIMHDYKGVKYLFCSDKCKNTFKNNPGKYLKKNKSN